MTNVTKPGYVQATRGAWPDFRSSIHGRIYAERKRTVFLVKTIIWLVVNGSSIISGQASDVL
jgi:hypothetical protein